ncbi:hypothetical protein [Nostoc sp. CHAB 5715]|nr:hypothetical protein [Nostoc sp. CHAB 5715]
MKLNSILQRSLLYLTAIKLIDTIVNKLVGLRLNSLNTSIDNKKT